MIRRAIASDLDQIVEGYHEHFLHEKKHGAYTVFQEGVFPTRNDAENALQDDALYVYVENGVVAGSMIINRRQPDEYRNIEWPSQAEDQKVMVIHLLLVRPGMAGKGIGSSLLNYGVKLVKQNSCEALRLDTGIKNTPAATLYQKSGFQIVAIAPTIVGGKIVLDKHLYLEKIVSFDD